ncbi:hypothetical protein A2Z67_06155 [Candidatus Woesebacteria bacterium RBG_13_36_22]|uniref:Uncharacterized protein n=1 Tax=Candidatus Woesebacteria bacterium RBG_13_36_22 TaxID=1802478 RepID=A0A1F7X8K7_9BACT|nr:MAG: hypothetical protein A2Z67_06155 [Candidatus Woesebacteria bacterium RBG_13_36_22]
MTILLVENQLPKFNRLLPPEGVWVYPEVWYRDINDISMEDRMEARKYLFNDDSYKALLQYRKYIKRGSKIGRMFALHVFRKMDIVCALTMTEFLDNPEGYGIGDFYFGKVVWPKFKHTKYSRYAASDLFHMVFKSNLAHSMYSYFLVKRETTGVTFWDRVDRSIPCLGIMYPTDGPDVQKYMIIKKEVETGDRKCMILELNGDIYRSMDLKAYFMTAPNRKEEIVDKWLLEMDDAAKKVAVMQV